MARFSVSNGKPTAIKRFRDMQKNSLTYRFSTSKDIIQIDNLLKLCFGDRSKYGALYHIERRYLLAYADNQLIAMTGVCDKTMSEFDGYEVDWTCCHPNYRKQGIITDMLSLLLKDKYGDIYCSCFCEPDKDKPNLHAIMIRLGFTCIQKGYKTFAMIHDNVCSDCNFEKGKNCKCREDLYFKKQIPLKI